MSDAKIVGLVAIKGGVGKTSCTVNLGAALASEFDKKVLLIDANYSAPNLGLHFGLVNPDITLHNIMLDEYHISESVYEYDQKLHIIPASLISKKVDPFKLKRKIEVLREYYDIILIDSSPNLNNEMLSVMLAADELLVVTSPDYPTLSTTLRAVKIAKDQGTKISGLIVNKVRKRRFEIPAEDIEDAVGVPVLGILNDDVNMLESVSKCTPLSYYKSKAGTVIEFNKLAGCLVNESYEDPRFLSKIKKIFYRSVPKDHLNRTLYNQVGRKL